ncbi:nucleoside deaminase [Planktothrix sp. FACHB-1355]|uniref:Nucleoside deaminase n=1 Tax=Aerosakkonema funiforme FACHB-1375 TaxID=2949571 RepID=A0A926ZGG6_9CYAN|nr:MULTISPECIES: nucleoside deaminase [Oscillatoriales]MBD2181117.1 nucleoside deaminase [Aerosakkonema funiforme FACHB-1375]MBD3560489.1 nucleoside deaminase [Planktothrix sp. FACHB-1355]
MNHKDFMKMAIEQAKQGDAPYGTVIVKNGEVAIAAHNTVKRDNDPSAHAEINAIRRLTAKIGNYSLQGYTLYTSCEPCPMCATACIWAGISEIVYGASIQDLIERGISQIDLPCEEIIAKGFRKIPVTKGILKAECLELFK